MKYLDSEEDVWSNDGLFCPDCKEEQAELQEVCGAYEEGESEMYCQSCGLEFKFSVYISYCYTSLKAKKVESIEENKQSE